MPLNYGGYNNYTGGEMSPRQMGMSPSFFNEVMQWGQQNGGGQQPGVNPSLPGVRPPQLRVPNGSYSPYGNQMLRPLGPPVPNGGVGGMRGGAASQGGVVMPAQGIRVGYGPAMPPSMPTNGNAPSRGLLMGNVPQQTPQPPAAPAQPPHPQIAMMNRQHENMKLGDQNSMALTATGENDRPLWKNNFDELIRQADVMENTQLPERPTGITPQQAFMQIPGNYLTGYQNRFNAIEANRPDTPPQVTASSASPEFKNYAQAIAQADPSFNPNAPAYSVDANGAITPRKPITPPVSVKVAEDGKITYGLTPEDAARMNAVGSSIGEWKKKADWLAKNGGGVMTPELAQKYADDQKIARDKLTANSDGLMQKWRDQKDALQNRRVAIAQRNFMIRNPGLFTPINPNAAQMVSSMAQGSLQRFTPSGLTPAEDARLKSDQSNQYMDQARYWASVGNSAMAEEAMRRSQEVWQNTNTINGSVPNQPPVNPRNVFSASQSFRDEQGDFNNTKFGDALAAHDAAGMTREGLLRDGINEQYLRDFIAKNTGTFWNSDAGNKNIERAKKALAILGGVSVQGKEQVAPPNATKAASIGGGGAVVSPDGRVRDSAGYWTNPANGELPQFGGVYMQPIPLR